MAWDGEPGRNQSRPSRTSDLSPLGQAAQLHVLDHPLP